MAIFGDFLRRQRESKLASDPGFSVRRLAQRIGIEPSYLSKIERGEAPPPSEATVLKLAAALEFDADVLLALAGKVATDLQEAIRRRPRLFARLIREVRDTPDAAVLELVRGLRQGPD
jgi:transcriptional regulator with XRE-family HTH domain